MLKHIYILFNYSLENESIGSCKKLKKLSSILKSDTYEYKRFKHKRNSISNSENFKNFFIKV